MKQTIKVVSSFAPDGYKLYGQKFIKSFLKHWPEDAELHIYHEDKKPAYTHKRIKYHNLFKVPGCMPTLQALGTFPVTQGQINGKRIYQMDAFRFVRKMFSQVDAATGFDGLLIWLDADTEFFEDVPDEWIRDRFINREDDLGLDHSLTFMTYMGRPDWHMCASFIGWNCAHPHNPSFWKAYYELILSGHFLMLPEWHDCYWIDFLREQMKFDAVNMSSGMALGKGPVNVFNKVFGTMGKHAKGNLKFAQGPQRYAQLIDIVKQLKPKTVIEIGTWNGVRAVEMHKASPGFKYVGFDLFESATDETDEYEKNVKPHHHAEDVSKMLNKAGIDALLFAGDTNETFPTFLGTFPNQKIDLIYIDGGHAVGTIKSDFECALKAIAPGGMIVLDDYYEDMPDENIEKWGCNKVLERSGLMFDVLPIGDPVKGGGVTKMAVVRG